MQKLTRILYPVLTTMLVVVVAFLVYALANQGQAPSAVLGPTKQVAQELDSLLDEVWLMSYGENAHDTAMMKPYLELIEKLERGNDPFATTALAKQLFPEMDDSSKGFQPKLPTEVITTALLERMLFLQDSIVSCDVTGQFEIRSFPLATRVKEGETFRVLVSAYHPKESNTWLLNPEFRTSDEVLQEVGDGKMKVFRSKVTQSVRNPQDTLRVEYPVIFRKPQPPREIRTDTVTSRYFITR
jgi:hypothetical protein